MKRRSFRKTLRSYYESVVNSISYFFWNIGRTYRSGTAVVASLFTIQEKFVVVAGKREQSRPNALQYANPIYWMIQVFHAVARYLLSRPPIAGVQGFPAMIGLAAPLIIFFLLTPSPQEILNHSKSRRDFLAEQKQYEDADFYARQMCFLSPQDSGVLFDRALLLDKMERSDEALLLNTHLANEKLYEPAIEWLCQRDLQDAQAEVIANEDRDKRLMARVTFLLEKNADNLRVNLMLGTLHLMRGQYTNAIPPLQKVVNLSRGTVPEAGYSLAVAYQNLGQNEAAAPHAAKAADIFRQRLSSQAYSSELLTQTLRAMILGRQESDAASLILQTIPQRTEAEANELNWLLAEVYAQWCKRLRTLPNRSPKDLAEALNVIYRGIAAAPQNPNVMDELTRLSCTTTLDDNLIQQQLDIAVNSGVSPGLVHFIQGTRLLLQDPPDTKAALVHLELAKTHNASLPGLLNNIADAMLKNEDSDAGQALTLIEQAIQMMPDQPYFYDTRGKAFLKQKEYLKAIADFERALSAVELRAVVHDQIAEAYRGLENPKEEQRHHDLAEFCRKSIAPATSDQKPRTKNLEPENQEL